MDPGKHYSYGVTVRDRVRHLFDVLLSYAHDELEDIEQLRPNLKVNWQTEKQLVVRTKLRTLEELSGKLTQDQIRDAINHYLKNYLKILVDNRESSRGSENWHFTLELWSKDKEQNLRRFNEEWHAKLPPKAQILSLIHGESGDNVVALGADEPSTSISISVEVASDHYVERVPFEAQCYEAILQPGALIRIKASQQMGKTSLLNSILTQARTHNYQTVTVSFELPNNAVFNDMNTFSQRFCALVSKQLELPDMLADYWKDNIFCSNDKTTDYFENYLLAKFTNPMVLALDKVDRVFEHPAIANDFCSLLRGWYDMARRSDRRGAIWKKLRLVVIHSTDVYGKLNINCSPLAGVGLPIRLLDFNWEQVQDLARRYGLNWVSNQEVEQLMAMIGGHPYLVRLAFNYLKSQEVTLEDLLQKASTEAGPFIAHLREHLQNLKRYPEIKAAFREVVMTNQPVRLESDAIFKLDSMGLIQIQNDDYCTVKYNLYRQYFSTRLTAT